MVNVTLLNIDLGHGRASALNPLEDPEEKSSVQRVLGLLDSA
jgi:hypothetical protein